MSRTVIFLMVICVSSVLTKAINRPHHLQKTSTAKPALLCTTTSTTTAAPTTTTTTTTTSTEADYEEVEEVIEDVSEEDQDVRLPPEQLPF